MKPYEALMRRALDVAETGLDTGDVPVGALVVSPDGSVLASAANARERDGDPTAHAELLALRAAAAAWGTWRLDGCTLVVTLEPCTMCAGALVLARVARLVYGDSTYTLLRTERGWSHEQVIDWLSDVLPGMLLSGA